MMTEPRRRTKAEVAQSNAWKERVWTAAAIAAIGAVQVIAVAWVDSRAVDRNKIVTDRVEEIHKATNSMKDALVEATEKEALARGGVQERARADAIKDKKDKSK